MKRGYLGIVGLSTCGLVLAAALGLRASGQAGAPDAGSTMFVANEEILWTPPPDCAGTVLTVCQPNGEVIHQEFAGGQAPVFQAWDADANRRPDGQYKYELKAVPVVDETTRRILDAARDSENRSAVVEGLKAAGKLPAASIVQSGSFRIDNGAFVAPTAVEPESVPAAAPTLTGAAPTGAAPGGAVPEDIVQNDDVIITGSLGVGFDCAEGESFGYDTIKLKENNLRLYFDDTSVSTFPANDWRIIANDSASGGASYFAIEDSTGAKTPFKIEAGAPTSSLHIDDYGRVGLGTSVPVLKMHMVQGDTPSVRLEQDTSSGWTAQTWDVAGNESNFFVRDTTNGSKLPFRIQPATPTNTLNLKSDGKVGIGTWSPESALEVEKTGEDVTCTFDRTDGGAWTLQCGAGFAVKGPDNEHMMLGKTNDANGNWAIAAGGKNNHAGGDYGAVAGGLDNRAGGWYAIAAGGRANSAAGSYAFAAGRGAEALHNGAFVWSDNAGGTFSSEQAGQFSARCYGGVRFYSDAAATVGVKLPIGSGSWVSMSDRNAKDNIEPVDSRQVVETLAQVPVTEWNYKTQSPDVRHIGPMAQDLQAAFGYGESDKAISTVDADGISFAAIQGLYQMVQDTQQALREKDARIQALEARLAALEQAAGAN